jgi:hypothetical protein
MDFVIFVAKEAQALRPVLTVWSTMTKETYLSVKRDLLDRLVNNVPSISVSHKV